MLSNFSFLRINQHCNHPFPFGDKGIGWKEVVVSQYPRAIFYNVQVEQPKVIGQTKLDEAIETSDIV